MSTAYDVQTDNPATVTTKRVLTIDGGGVRGVFAAAIIEQMELKTKKRANQLFDLICGTSAGSVVAAGLARGIPAGDLKNVFIKLGKSAFSEAGNGDSGNFENALKELAGGENTRPRDLKNCFLAIPARNMRIGRTVLFGNLPDDLYPDQESFVDSTGIDENDELWEVLRRSTALPPFFSPAGDYLDGGISPFANPSYLAYVGALYRLGWSPCELAMRFYSVGTGFHEKTFDLNGLPLDKIKDAMIEALMQDINFLQHQIMKRRGNDRAIWYKRYNLGLTRKGYEKFGWTVPSPEELDRLASTDNPPVEKLAELGTRVGQATVVDSDFDAGTPLEDRRGKRPDRRSGPRRVSIEIVDPVTESQSRQRRRDRRRRERRRESGPMLATPTG